MSKYTKKLSKWEELSNCIDECCNMEAVVIVASNILIQCMKCSKLVSVTGNCDSDQLRAMVNWNKMVRKKYNSD